MLSKMLVALFVTELLLAGCREAAKESVVSTARPASPAPGQDRTPAMPSPAVSPSVAAPTPTAAPDLPLFFVFDFATGIVRPLPAHPRVVDDGTHLALLDHGYFSDVQTFAGDPVRKDMPPSQRDMSAYPAGASGVLAAPDGRHETYWMRGADGRSRLVLRDLAAGVEIDVPGKIPQCACDAPIWTRDIWSPSGRYFSYLVGEPQDLSIFGNNILDTHR